jgi:hypothetical protein
MSKANLLLAYWGPLNSIPELENISTMPAKWQKLIELSQQLIIEKQVCFFID